MKTRKINNIKTLKKKTSKSKIRTCRICGCTDEDSLKCTKKTGLPCNWFDKDLCSTCACVDPKIMMKSIFLFEQYCRTAICAYDTGKDFSKYFIMEGNFHITNISDFQLLKEFCNFLKYNKFDEKKFRKMLDEN
ncbi:MAG: hypothetical protein WC781_05535 [Candidatus Pacearchaeota archaeon]|jgi:hypothetical protein